MVRIMRLLRFVIVLAFTLIIFYLILLASGVSLSYLQKKQQDDASFPEAEEAPADTPEAEEAPADTPASAATD